MFNSAFWLLKLWQNSQPFFLLSCYSSLDFLTFQQEYDLKVTLDSLRSNTDDSGKKKKSVHLLTQRGWEAEVGAGVSYKWKQYCLDVVLTPDITV